jgi:hypothetical protein
MAGLTVESFRQFLRYNDCQIRQVSAGMLSELTGLTIEMRSCEVRRSLFN